MPDSLLTGNLFIAARPGHGPGVVIFGAPMDVTTSFRPGTRMGPNAIREVSQVIETYDMHSGLDMEHMDLWDAGNVELVPGEVIGSLERIERVARAIVAGGGAPLMLGGEHLVTLPAVSAVFEKHPSLAVVHLDAHADMRLDYLGRELTHAGVMRRVSMLIGRENVYSAGIRSASADEIEYARSPAANFHALDLSAVPGFARALKGRPVYLTVDIDVVDPAGAPGTGAPEAGGVTSAELFAALESLRGLNIVAADVVEVAPAYDHAAITAILAAKVTRQIALAMR